MNQTDETDSSNEDREKIGLDELGLGPDSSLMHEPKLFQEQHFLGLVLAELEQEYGQESGRRALFQIGARHGMRDARSIWQAPAASDTDEGLQFQGRAPTLPMRLLSQNMANGGVEIHGTWPDRHEAGARLSGLGKSLDPACFLSAGYTSGWLSESQGCDIVVMEETCLVAGDDSCQFRAVPASPGGSSSLAFQGFEPKPVAQAPTGMSSPTASGEDSRQAIHVWGPVMVLPYARAQDAETTLTKLTEDESLRGVRVVVVDLSAGPTPLGCDTSPLRELLDAIERRGAETVLTGLSPALQARITSVQRPLLIAPGGLPEAIAMAFRVAEAGRHLI